MKTDYDTAPVIRVRYDPGGDFYTVLGFGLDPEQWARTGLKEGSDYAHEELPAWLAEKIAKLEIFPPPPPRIAVENIGQRMSEHTFWIAPPDEVEEET